MRLESSSSRRRRAAVVLVGLIVGAVAVVGLVPGSAGAAEPVVSAARCTTILAIRVCSGPPTPSTTPSTAVTTPTVPVTTPPVPMTLPTTTTLAPRTVNDLANAVPELLVLMNADRAAAGLPALRARADVNALAQAHSRNMAARHEIWHNDDYFSSATRAALAAGAMGQNVAMNHSVAGAERAFMASPHHKDNILDARFSVVGLGIATDERGIFYVTQDFIQPKGAPRAAAAPRTPVTLGAPSPGGAAKPRTTTTARVAPAPTHRSAVVPAEAVALVEPAPREEVAVDPARTFQLAPASASDNDALLLLLGAFLLFCATGSLLRQMVAGKEYAKVR